MKGINVDNEKCIKCGACVDGCPFGAIEMTGDTVSIGDECRLCGVCVDICPVGAIKRDAYEGGAVDKSFWKGILIYVQHNSAGINPITFEMAGAAAKLAEKTGDKIYAVSISGGGYTDFSPLAGMVERVFVYNGAEYEDFRDDVYAAAFIDCVDRLKPSIVLLGATVEARTLAPRVAVAFKTGLTADCTSLDINDNGDLLQIRPAFGGDVMAEILTEHTRPQLATVRGHIMQAAGEYCSKTVSVSHMDNPDRVKDLVGNVDVVDKTRLEPTKDIADQRILVAIGNGIERKEDIPMFEEFAESIGGMLASSRSLVEKGWMPGERQIGISGKAVGCELLITCGVSGSVQFLAGVSGVGHIIAINKDKTAPIFGVAHTLVNADIYDIIPALCEKIKCGKEA